MIEKQAELIAFTRMCGWKTLLIPIIFMYQFILLQAESLNPCIQRNRTVESRNMSSFNPKYLKQASPNPPSSAISYKWTTFREVTFDYFGALWLQTSLFINTYTKYNYALYIKLIFLYVSAINRHPQRDINTQEYII